ncbi:MAG TPA: ornithine cyclodeaminase family protein [Chthoniobacterales bacterium]|jgi:ornithine cyclodeaminase/alanine dehydrogenase|nr:ornithine cyclodeaminase family protein [Chthoniobacterales bacterium]
MKPEETLLLSRSEVARLLTIPDCIRAVEEMFRQLGDGKLPPPGILGIKSKQGGLHIKAAHLSGARDYIVAKLNTNFPRNRIDHGLPTIQGLIVVCDGVNGRPLAVLDSIDLTIKRTAAASAVAAKYLARPDSTLATICGCGQQAAAQLSAICTILPLKEVYAFDSDPNAAKNFAVTLTQEFAFAIKPTRDLPSALQRSDVCITCTTATEFFVRKADVPAGIFIAAVGADDSHKQEIEPALIAAAKVVADSLDQCSTIGDTHHAIATGLMRKEDVYAELSEIVAGKKPGRTSDDEITIFDSTGIALEDAVAAVAVYENAHNGATGSRFEFAA